MAWWLCPSHPLTSPPIVQCSSHQVPATGPLTVTTTGGWHAASVPPISLLLRFFLYSLDLFHDFCAEGPRIAFQGDTWPTTFFFSFFISLQVARFGWSSLRWPALHFLQDSIDTARRGQHYRSIPEWMWSNPPKTCSYRRYRHKHPPSG